MKRVLLAALIASTSMAATARDQVVTVPLKEVVDLGLAEGKLDGSVKFYLAGSSPKVSQRLGSGVSNKKTNSVGKDDVGGCKYVALSALIAFQDSAKARGANAVVDMASYYKRVEKKDPVTIECHAGNIIMGTTLKGEYAKL